MKRVDKATASMFVLIVCLFCLTSPVFSDAWLNGDPNAIWSRAPGLYKEGTDWYAIIHVPSTTKRVRLIGDFTNWKTAPVDLTRTPDQKFWWFKGSDFSFANKPMEGDKYKFIVTDKKDQDSELQDPAARRVENSALSSNSLVTVSSAYQWHDNAWARPGWEYYSVYQVHPKRFTDRNGTGSPLTQVAEELNGNSTHDYLKDLRCTAIQLLPVNEFPGDLSWGYNPSFFYAIESSYGSPDDLKRLVDTAHQNGIAVILDLVYNHGGASPQDNILWQIAQSDLHTGTYYDGDTKWGPMINFDNDVARHFFVQNAVYLAKEYHIDGFRFDATRLIHDSSDSNIKEGGSGGGWQFLRELREKVKSLDSKIVLIAEELPNDWYMTKEDVGTAWGSDRHAPFDSQWADDFHDKLKSVLVGGHLNGLFQVFTNLGDSWEDGLIYSESHDEVGNTDDRIAKRGRDGKGWEMNQLSAAATILGRGIPMIFMGQESGEVMQFGQDDDKLPAKSPGAYDPGTGNTWWDDRLDLNNYESDPGRKKIHDWFQKMFEIRRGAMDTFAKSDIQITQLHNDDGIVAFTRDGGKYLVVLNFRGKSWDNYNVGIWGRYQELANTSWPVFNLGATPEKTRGGDSGYQIDGVPIPAYGAVILVRWD